MPTTLLTAEPIPKGFQTAADDGERHEIEQWLAHRTGSVSSLGLLLRIDESLADEMNHPESGSLDHLFHASCHGRFRQVKQIWFDVIPSNSAWRDLLEFPGVHACVIRGPAEKLIEFVGRRELDRPDSPVAGLIVPEPLETPSLTLSPQQSDRLNAVRRKVESVFQSHNVPVDAGSLFKLPMLQAAMAASPDDGEPEGDGESEFDKIRRLLNSGGNGYLDGLGMGGLDSWGNRAGLGQSVCVLDSGADEGHPVLRQRVAHTELFDSYGQLKKVIECTDRGCHGTKVASLICGNPATAADLGITELGVMQPDELVRIGVAPGAQVIPVSVLQGEFKHERGSLIQLLAGIGWTIGNRHRGYKIVNISMKPRYQLNDRMTRVVDDQFAMMRHFSLLPILAGGPGRLGTTGYYVGAADRDGKPIDDDDDSNLLVTGRDILCAQPQTPALDDRLIGCYDGSSLSSAILSGIVAGLMSLYRKPLDRVIKALEETADDRFVDVDAAALEL